MISSPCWSVPRFLLIRETVYGVSQGKKLLLRLGIVYGYCMVLRLAQNEGVNDDILDYHGSIPDRPRLSGHGSKSELIRGEHDNRPYPGRA